jgi:hypothetical protein
MLSQNVMVMKCVTGPSGRSRICTLMLPAPSGSPESRARSGTRDSARPSRSGHVRAHTDTTAALIPFAYPMRARPARDECGSTFAARCASHEDTKRVRLRVTRECPLWDERVVGASIKQEAAGNLVAVRVCGPLDLHRGMRRSDGKTLLGHAKVHLREGLGRFFPVPPQLMKQPWRRATRRLQPTCSPRRRVNPHPSRAWPARTAPGTRRPPFRRKEWSMPSPRRSKSSGVRPYRKSIVIRQAPPGRGVASRPPRSCSIDLGASLSDQGHGGMIDGFGGLRVKV